MGRKIEKNSVLIFRYFSNTNHPTITNPKRKFFLKPKKLCKCFPLNINEITVEAD